MRPTLRLGHGSRGIVALVGGALLVAVTVVPGVAATRTTIRIDNNFDTGTGAFTTTGGALCASGSSTPADFRFSGGGRAGTFHLTKTLVCDDGSGSFTIDVNAATANGSPTDQGGWSVVGGTGAYATLQGGGNLVGTYVPTGIIDLYTGVVTR